MTSVHSGQFQLHKRGVSKEGVEPCGRESVPHVEDSGFALQHH